MTVHSVTPASHKLLCRTTHENDAAFPLTPPDMWFRQYTKPSHQRTDMKQQKYVVHGDYDFCRTKYLEKMKANRSTRNNVWRRGRKHYVPGSLYHNVIDRFYVVKMDQPVYKNDNKLPARWVCSKYVLEVAVRDDKQNITSVSFVEFAHTPLRQTSQIHKQGLGRYLYKHTKSLSIDQNDCRKGVHTGSMAVSGNRLYDNELIPYANTTQSFKAIEESSRRYLRRYGFADRVNTIHQEVVDAGGNDRTLRGSQARFLWCTLSVTTKNYGNECHLDTNDYGLGITIWHKENPPAKALVNPCITNWFFLFPDMEVRIDGEWRKGVAIPLQHGTVISWDARIIRHCTACPHITAIPKHRLNAGKPSSCAYGTYFGNQSKVVHKLQRK